MKFHFKSNKSILEKFLSKQSNLELIKRNDNDYIQINKLIKNDELDLLISFIRKGKYEVKFKDNLILDNGISGIDYSYKAIESDMHRWNMTFSKNQNLNGIFKVWTTTLFEQLISLIKKGELTQIQISNENSNFQLNDKSEEENWKKHNEITWIHSQMTTEEIINRICSLDSRQIVDVAHEIISISQDRNATKPFIPFINEIKKLNHKSKYIEATIKILEFHKYSNKCTCELYNDIDWLNPRKEDDKGFVKINKITKTNNESYLVYEIICVNCNQTFSVEEKEYHSLWWKWIKNN
jgi:hypothetical protein